MALWLRALDSLINLIYIASWLHAASGIWQCLYLRTLIARLAMPLFYGVTWRLVSGVMYGGFQSGYRIPRWDLYSARFKSTGNQYGKSALAAMIFLQCQIPSARASFNASENRWTDHARRADDSFSAPLVGYSRAAGKRFLSHGLQFSSIGRHR